MDEDDTEYKRRAAQHLREAGIDPDTVDIEAERDSTLSSRENVENFKRAYPASSVEHMARNVPSRAEEEAMHGRQSESNLEGKRKADADYSRTFTRHIESQDIRDIGGAEAKAYVETKFLNPAKQLYGEAKQVYGAVKRPYDVAKERYDMFQSERREQQFRQLESKEAEVKSRYELAKRKDDVRTLEKEESRLRNKPMADILAGIGGALRGVGRRERREERPRYYRREPRYRARPRYREPSREMRREDRFGGAQSGAAQLLSGTGSSMLHEERQPRRFERREAPSGIAAMLHGTGSGASSFLGGNRSGSGFPEFGVNLKKKRF